MPRLTDSLDRRRRIEDNIIPARVHGASGRGSLLVIPRGSTVPVEAASPRTYAPGAQVQVARSSTDRGQGYAVVSGPPPASRGASAYAPSSPAGRTRPVVLPADEIFGVHLNLSNQLHYYDYSSGLGSAPVETGPVANPGSAVVVPMVHVGRTMVWRGTGIMISWTPPAAPVTHAMTGAQMSWPTCDGSSVYWVELDVANAPADVPQVARLWRSDPGLGAPVAINSRSFLPVSGVALIYQVSTPMMSAGRVVISAQYVGSGHNDFVDVMLPLSGVASDSLPATSASRLRPGLPGPGNLSYSHESSAGQVTSSDGELLSVYAPLWPATWGDTRAISRRWGTDEALGYNLASGLAIASSLVPPFGPAPRLSATVTAGSQGIPTWLFLL